jgi:hypothetical protein
LCSALDLLTKANSLWHSYIIFTNICHGSSLIFIISLPPLSPTPLSPPLPPPLSSSPPLPPPSFPPVSPKWSSLEPTKSPFDCCSCYCWSLLLVLLFSSSRCRIAPERTVRDNGLVIFRDGLHRLMLPVMVRVFLECMS